MVRQGSLRAWPVRLAAVFAFVIVVSVLPTPDLLGWTALILGFAVIWVIGRKDPRVRNLLIAAFAVRALFALVHYYITPLPDSQVDAISFERTAAQWAAEGFGGVVRNFTTGAYLYSWIIGVLYSITGRSPLMAQALNVLFGTLIVWNVYSISCLLWGEKLALRATTIAAFFPTLVLYSAITTREVAVVYPFTLGCLYCVHWLQTNRPRAFLASLAAFGVSTAFHTAMLIALLVLLIAAYARLLRALVDGNRSCVVRSGFSLAVVIIGIGAVLASGWGLEKVAGLAVINPVEWLAELQLRYARGRAAYLEWIQPHTFFDLFWQTPIRVVYFLFAPFPWMVQSSEDLLGLLISVLNLVLVLLLIRSLSGGFVDVRARWLFWVLASLLVGFSLTTSNYGTALRHSSKLVPLALCLVKVPRIKIGRARQ